MFSAISGAVGFRTGSESEIPASTGFVWMVAGDVGSIVGVDGGVG